MIFLRYENRCHLDVIQSYENGYSTLTGFTIGQYPWALAWQLDTFDAPTNQSCDRFNHLYYEYNNSGSAAHVL